MRFIFGAVTGLALGLLTLVGAIGGFIGGIALGYGMLKQEREEKSAQNETEIPIR